MATHTDIFLIVVLIIAGLVIGSFLGMLSYRWPRAIFGTLPVTSSAKRSYCPECGSTLRFQYLFPVLSYIFCRGSATCCGAKISPRYFFIELSTSVSFVIAGLLTPYSHYLYWLPIICLLILMVTIDLEFLIVPNLLLILSIMWVLTMSVALETPQPAVSAITSGVIGFMLLKGSALMANKLSGKNTLGLADPYVMAITSAHFTYEQIPYLLLGTSLWGICLYVFFASFFGKTRIPLVPAIILSQLSCMMVFY